MAKIDLYLKNLAKFGATGVQLASGENVTLKFPAGDRYASQITAHADLVAIVEEIAPPAAAPALKRGKKASFGYDFGGALYQISVDPKPAGWKVLVEPAPAAAPAAADMSLPELDLPIEHTSYAEAEAAPPAARPTISGMQAPPPSGRIGGGAPPAAPPTFSMDKAKPIEKLLLKMKEMGCSDLHLCTGSPPSVRLHGEIKVLEGYPSYEAENLYDLITDIMPPKNRKEFEERNDTDFAHAIPGVSRFRCNAFRDRHGPGAVMRAIPFQLLTPEQLGLPKTVLELCYLTKGLVLVTGPTGSGKSTTLATLVDHCNANRRDHIITIEDPIEFVHENKQCLVNQREVHTHTRSFKDALRAALREDPDIVLVGEMRDLETVAIAVETAETGHLVFGTLHTTTAPSTIDRIIDQFPADRQEQIRQMLSESLRGVIAQVLCKKIGGGRVAAYEILLGSSAVSNLIRESKTFQLFSLMQTARGQGMVTLNDSLLDLVKKGIVAPKEAFMKAVNKQEFKQALEREGFKTGLG